jgi:hypothetical protein
VAHYRLVDPDGEVGLDGMLIASSVPSTTCR